jgi:hypothetical protein
MNRLAVFALIGCSLLLFPAMKCGHKPPPPPPLEPGILLDKSLLTADPAKITQLQNDCLRKAPDADCVLDPGVDRELKFSASKENNNVFLDDPLTYHNDSVDGRDQTVDILFRRFFLDKTASNDAVTYQHTHGKEHALVVITKGKETNCEPQATLYKLKSGDQIEVYYDELGKTIPLNAINDGTLDKDVRLTLEKRDDHGEMDCKHSHEYEKPRNLFWKVETPKKHDLVGTERVLPTRPETEVNVRNGTALRHLQLLSSGCSAWKVCTRVGDDQCDAVPLCAVHLYKTMDCGCESPKQ